MTTKPLSQRYRAARRMGFRPAFLLCSLLSSTATLSATADSSTTSPIYEFSKWEFPGNTHDCRWPYEQIELDAAHRLFSDRAKPGEGVVVAAVDSGYIPTESLMDDGTLPKRGIITRDFTFDSPSVGIQDFLDGGEPYDIERRGDNFGHGTMVMNIIGGLTHSPEVRATGWKGLAPWVRLLPFRVTHDVVVQNKNDRNRTIDMANGMMSAVHSGAHVINVSLGAPLDPGGRIRHAAEVAENRGVIVVSASAQYVPFSMMPYPGRVPSVVATTGTTREGTFWARANGHPDVDVAAPANDMCAPRAQEGLGGLVVENLAGKRLSWNHLFISGGRGTTYSAAFVTGAAALWLSYHGPETIAQLYGKKNTARLFRYMLKNYGVTTPEGWNTSTNGAGMLNVRKLLEAPLPDEIPADYR